MILFYGFSKYTDEQDALFSIKWPGPSMDSFGDDFELLRMYTGSMGVYSCFVPKSRSVQPNKNTSNEDILKLFSTHLTNFLKSRPQCIRKPENYWVFELCHGSQVRQFHTGGPEYSLGYFDNHTNLVLDRRFIERKRSDGVFVHYEQGSECPLLGEESERSVKVFYTCGKTKRIIRVTEVSTCTYEII
ncbi:hypothetical protein ACOME3_008248 [Neoechinorhynchus agilis]